MPWFRKRKKETPARPPGEYSPGGSRLYQYGENAFGQSRIGFTEEDTREYAEAREAEFERMFGKCDQVSHEIMPLVPHIDVFQYPPGHTKRDFWTLVTSGMSDLRMTLPEGVDPKHARAELVFYCDEPRPEYLGLLRIMAHFPHDNQTWLGHGHTMPNGMPPEPLFAHTPGLSCVLFSYTIVRPDQLLGERLRIAGDPVNLLWVIPISERECQAKLDRGIDFLLEVFDKVRHPHVFAGDRRSYVQSMGG